jgi:hypothetical protein
MLRHVERKAGDSYNFRNRRNVGAARTCTLFIHEQTLLLLTTNINLPFYFLFCLSICTACSGVVDTAPIRCMTELHRGRDFIFSCSLVSSSSGKFTFLRYHSKPTGASSHTLSVVVHLRQPESRPPPSQTRALVSIIATLPLQHQLHDTLGGLCKCSSSLLALPTTQTGDQGEDSQPAK